MCLIVETDANNPMTLDFVKNVMIKNDDGYGMMWVNQDGKVQTEKSATSKPESLFELYEAIKDLNPVIHFRMRTHGDVNEENTHPYPCGNDVWVMHNGVLRSGNSKDVKFSDTWHFVEDVIKPLFSAIKDPEMFIHTAVFIDLVEEYIGYSNKMVFMSKYGHTLTHPLAWHTINNPWTNMKGVRVSNQYAWNEGAFRDPTPAPVTLSRKQQKRLARRARREGAIIGTPPSTDSNGGTKQAGFNFGRPEDHFRSSASGFEEWDEDFFLDMQNNVWARTPNGYRRIFGMTFEDLVKRSKSIASRLEREKQEIQNETEESESTALIVIPETRIEIPALVLPKQGVVAVNDPEGEEHEYTDEEVEEAIEKLASHGYDEEMYKDALFTAWSKKTSDELAELLITNPEEALIVLEKALNITVPKEDNHGVQG